MQPLLNIRDIQTNLSGRTTNATIHANAQMFRLLSDRLYSDKITAILRELGANALDAHVAAGRPDKPFFVHLPTSMDPVLRIRDYGNGMSEEFLHEHYFTYGDTNKAHTNDLVGGLGLGGKCPLAYTDSYQIITWTNGQKKTYIVYIDSNGKPALNGPVYTSPSDEEDGVEITMAVDHSDFQRFQESAARVFRWFSPIPTINAPVEKISWTIKTDTYGIPRSNRAYNTLFVLMGPIAYPLNLDLLRREMPATAYTPQVQALFQTHGLCLFAPVGSIDITPNREALSYDKRSLAKLYALLEATAATLIEEYQRTIDATPTFCEGRLLQQTLISGNPAHYDLIRNLTWKGQNLNKPIRISSIPLAWVVQRDFKTKTLKSVRPDSSEHSFRLGSETDYKVPVCYYQDDPSIKVNQVLAFNRDALWLHTPFLLIYHTDRLNDVRIAFDDLIEIRKLSELPAPPKKVRVKAPRGTRAARPPTMAALEYYSSDSSRPSSGADVFDICSDQPQICYFNVSKGQTYSLTDSISQRSAFDYSHLQTWLNSPQLLHGWTAVAVPEHYTKVRRKIVYPTLAEVLTQRITEHLNTDFDPSFWGPWADAKNQRNEITFLLAISDTIIAKLRKRLPYSPLMRLTREIIELNNRMNTVAVISGAAYKLELPPSTHAPSTWTNSVRAHIYKTFARYPFLRNHLDLYCGASWRSATAAEELMVLPGFPDYVHLHDNLRND